MIADLHHRSPQYVTKTLKKKIRNAIWGRFSKHVCNLSLNTQNFPRINIDETFGPYLFIIIIIITIIIIIIVIMLWNGSLWQPTEHFARCNVHHFG